MNSTGSSEWWNDNHALLFTVIEGVQLCPIIVGNCFLLRHIITLKLFRKRSYCLIISASISDLLVGSIVIPYDIVIMLAPIVSERRLPCLTFYVIVLFIIGASVINIFLMSVERYIAVALPFMYYTKSSTTILIKSVIAGWITAFILSILPLFGLNDWRTGIVCLATSIFTKSYLQLVLTIYILFMISSVILYIATVRKTIEHLHKTNSKRLRNLEISDVTKMPVSISRYKEHLKKNMRKSIAMICMFGIFILCWSPFALLTVIRFFYENDVIHLLESYFLTFGFANSCFNWIVFVMCKKRMRNYCKCITLCRS